MVKLNLVRATKLGAACSDRDVSRCKAVALLALRGIRPAYDEPFALADGRGQPLQFIKLDRPLPVWGYRAVGAKRG